MKKALVLLFIICVTLLGCGQRATSKDIFDYWRDRVDLNIVITDKSDKQRNVTLYGRRIDNNHDTTFINQTGYLLKMYDTIHIGDTIIKPKGKYTMHIKNKNGGKDLPFKYSGAEIADTVKTP